MNAPTSTTATPNAPAAWEGGDLVLTRVFEAPRERVFRAWADPEHFRRWFAPAGSTMPYCALDVRPGGTLHFQHHHPGYGDVWVGGVYEEVAEPERIVFTTFFSDETGARVERPGFPEEMRIAVAFDEVEGGTRVTVRQSGLRVDQGEVRGWHESLERLNAYLPRLGGEPGST